MTIEREEITRVTLTGSASAVTFDATISEQHTHTAAAPEHPVEDGVPISTQIRRKPYEATIRVAMTLTPTDTTEPEPDRDFRLHADLIDLWERHEPVKMDCYLGSFENLAILEVSTPVEVSDGASFTVDVRVKEIRIARSRTTDVPAEFIAAVIAADAAAQEPRGRDDDSPELRDGVKRDAKETAAVQAVMDGDAGRLIRSAFGAVFGG